MPQLQSVFQHSLPFPLWRLRSGTLADGSGGLLAELRDGSSKTLHLNVWQIPAGKSISPIDLMLPWSAGVQAVVKGLALYHRYDNDRLPVPTALGCLDLTTGQIRWEWVGHALTGYDATRVMARPTTLHETGRLSDVFFRLSDGEPEEGGLPLSLPDDALMLPVSYAPSSSYWPVIARFITKLVNHQPEGSIAYLEVANAILIAYTVHEIGLPLRSYLVVTDRNHTLWLHEEFIGSDIPEETAVSQTERFCVWNRQLVILYHNHQLTSYYLHTTP